MITNVGTIEKIKYIVENDPRIVILNFFANWCTPCQMLTPELAAMERFYGNRILIIQIDVERFPRVADTFGIVAMPTLIFFFNKILWKNLTITGGDMGQAYDNVNVLLTQHNDGETPLKRSLTYNPPN